MTTDKRTMLDTPGAVLVDGLSAQACPVPTGRRREVPANGNARARAKRPLAADASPSVFENFHRSILQVRGELRMSLSGIQVSHDSKGARVSPTAGKELACDV